MFYGSIPALVTPFSGKCVDEDSLREFVEWQITEGSNALVPCGTTGESATLSRDEQVDLVTLMRLAVATPPGRFPGALGRCSPWTGVPKHPTRAPAGQS